MQNWDNMQAATAAATYEQHNNNNNNWYNSMFAQTEIKTEPDTDSRMHEQQTGMLTTTTTKHKTTAVATSDVMSHLENYLRQQQQHVQQQQQPQTPQQISTVDSLSSAMTPSPSNTDSLQQLVYDSGMQTQLLQQQQYQQQFQQAQQAAAHNQVTSTTPHLPLGFNPLTPPGLPTAIIPTITHFYHQQQQQQQHSNNNARLNGQQTPSPQPLHAARHTHTLAHTHAHMVQPPTTPMDSSEKLQSALTPRNTPPMDITPPKSPTKSQIAQLAEAMHMQQEKQEQDAQSDTSDDMKYTGELDDDKMIREPIYNSHGKIKNYKCKSCGLIAITKVLFWEHARTHMKPEKILQCPKCPFVTELKHHLEYHIRKHKNLKPFQCDKCSYTCVNKSMLNSHRKSHSSVYQYRCADCDYATKYCHSFKLHLRKYDHKPGLVLDEEGLPNPSVVIDVYGTRRGPKSKSTAGTTKRSNSHTSQDRLHAKSMQQCQENGGSDFKLSASQLTAALQSFSMPTQQQHHQMPVSPAKSPSSLSSSSELQTTRALNAGLSQSHQQQQQQPRHQHKQQQMPPITHATQAKLQRQSNLKHASPEHSALSDAKSSMSNLLPPLASILQQNPNMAFFPYWNLNLQMLAAQQQAAALAQMPTNMREKAFKELQNLHSNQDTYNRSPQHTIENEVSDDDDDNDDDDESVGRKSTDSAMDLSQGSPVKDDSEQRRTPATCMNLQLHEETTDTPIVTTNGAARRKGRVLKLDALLQVNSTSAESLVGEEEPQAMPLTNSEHVHTSPQASPIPNRSSQVAETEKLGNAADACAAVAMDMDSAENAVKESLSKSVNAACASNTSTNLTASSSGNSSNGSSTASNTSTTTKSPPALGTMYECKYCDIYFKDAVLYTIHMGYHSCDDVFKCNMCGEKCDGPVGLFVHMARNAHS